MIDTKRARDIVRALRCTRSIALNYKKTKTVCPEWSETITDDAAEMIERFADGDAHQDDRGLRRLPSPACQRTR